MTSARNLALWLAAAIVMIAASLMPSVASAHGGHEHGSPPVAAAAFEPGASTHAVKAGAVRSVVSQAEARLLCTGACCAPGGHLCSSCCAAGLMPSGEPTWAVPTAGGRELARDVPSPPGIAPEALPEPPRPIV